MQYLENLDIFGEEVQLNLSSKQKFQSKFGGCVSLATGILLLIIIINGLIDLFNKNEFNVQIRTRLEINPEQAVLNMENFMFGILVNNPIKNEDFIDRKFVNIKLAQQLVERHDNGTEKPKITTYYEMEPCTLEHFSKQNKDYEIEFKSNNIQNFYCLPMEYQLILAGQYSSPKFQYAQIQIELCLNEEGCLTREEFNVLLNKKEIYKNFQISTVMTNSIIDLYAEELENQVQKFLFQDFFLYGSYSDSYQKSNVYIQKNQLLVDQSLVPFIESKDVSDIYSVSMNNIRTLDYKDENKEIFSQIYFRMAYEYIMYDKKYQQLDQYLSYVGGLFQIFISILGVLVIQYNKQIIYISHQLRLSLLIHIANRLYQFDIPSDNQINSTYQDLIEKIQEKIDQAKKHLKSIKTKLFAVNQFQKQQTLKVQTNNKTSLHAIDQNKQVEDKIREDDQQFDDPHLLIEIDEINKIKMKMKVQHQNSLVIKKKQQESNTPQTHPHISIHKKKFLNDVFHDIIEAKQTLSFTLKYLISSLFFFKIANNKKTQLIKKTLDRVTQDLDIIAIVDRLQDIEKLKKVLFNENQRRLFSYSPKPVISLNKDAHQLQLENEEKGNNYQ